MPSKSTTRLRVMQQAKGENVNVWGEPNLNDALQRLEEGIAKVLTLTITGNRDLTSQNYIEDEARSAALILTGTPSAAFKVTIPSVEKLYLVDNRTGRIANIGAASGAAAAVRAGVQSVVVCNGTDTVVVDLTLDRIKAPAAAVDMNGQRLTGLGPGSAGTDAATLDQVASLTAASVQRADDWANKIGAPVDGVEYSAREYASGAATPTGSAKAWATSTGQVAGGQKGARGYAQDASGSATASSDSASAAGASAGAASGSANAAAAALADFNNRYVVAANFPTTGNFAGRVAFSTAQQILGVYDAVAGAYKLVYVPQQATESVAGVLRIASQATAEAGTDNADALTALKGKQLFAVSDKVDFQEFTTSGTYTKPTRAKLLLIEIINAGSSGDAVVDNATGASITAAGGSRGGSFRAILPASLFGATVSVAIGAAGAARTSTSGRVAGAVGGQSSFGTYTGASPSAEGPSYAPGNGGIAFYGSSDGSIGATPGDSAAYAGRGGNGAAVASGTATAEAGQGPGGGGGGALSRSGTAVSGAGAPGRIRVWAFS